MTLSQALAQFLNWVELHRAENTLKLYRGRLRSLDASLGQLALADLTRLQIENWLATASRKRDGSVAAPDTRRANAIAFSVFQRWCVDHEILKAAIVAKLEKPAGKQRERIPTDVETQQLLSLAGPQFRLIYAALRQCGARPGELCSATIGDYDRVHGVIVLSDHKTAHATGRDRRIAVGKKFAELLATAIGERTDEAAPLFLDERGRGWHPRRLSAMYRKFRDQLGLSKDLVLYLARHEHGTIMTKKLGINAAKEALGHTSIKTTQRYAHTTDEERAANQDAFG